jgi:hypothetical protein
MFHKVQDRADMWLLGPRYSYKYQPSLSRYSAGLMFTFLITTGMYEAENITVAGV